ncbi:hypothetical protein BDF20DRAFT_182815 [Mycotypha africana]|uniref:uncharacterized protein n=1 Tax=Mycotypha africana TaxID=64632 RepID=UPI002300F768|nr:uncharacterized protein BDF20DRAFT_182815 [Mycotypha africana]KAI8968461.1 hypothetical protein BDF20DRAFT_182815 [Mycotypha africana]
MELIELEHDDVEKKPSLSIKFQKNIPRKIIFCIDVSNEMSRALKPSANGGVGNSNLYFNTVIETVQRFLKRYVNINTMLGSNDEYGIILLEDEAQWWCDLTSDTDAILKQLDRLHEKVIDNIQYGTFDLQSLYSVIDQNVNIRETKDFFYQCILVYARTAKPTPLTNQFYRAQLRNSPMFTMDVIYLHEKSNVWRNDIYEILNSMDSDVNPGWYFETSLVTAMDNLAVATTQLIGHPLQRKKTQHE